MKDEHDADEKFGRRTDDFAKEDRTFGDPEVQPRLKSCLVHGQIPSGRINWQGTEPHCPECGRKLESIPSDQGKT
jgi:hypothetical protein